MTQVPTIKQEKIIHEILKNLQENADKADDYCGNAQFDTFDRWTLDGKFNLIELAQMAIRISKIIK